MKSSKHYINCKTQPHVERNEIVLITSWHQQMSFHSGFKQAAFYIGSYSIVPPIASCLIILHTWHENPHA